MVLRVVVQRVGASSALPIFARLSSVPRQTGLQCLSTPKAIGSTIEVTPPRKQQFFSFQPFLRPKRSSYALKYYSSQKPNVSRSTTDKLGKSPDISSTSSVTKLVGSSSNSPNGADSKDTPVISAVATDLKSIREAFSLSDVPKSVTQFGLLGVVPYVLTSASTMFLAWDIDFAHTHHYSFFFQPHAAESLLHILEPIQIGYGAVILSFLGAIHWGLEFAEFGGNLGYKRYAIGILAPLLAWPTVMLPLDYALLVQFLGFTAMYSVDVTASKWGWAPRWYPTYRFLLTFIVGASIVVTLVGRGKVGDKISHLQKPSTRVVALKNAQFSALRAEEERKAEKFDRMAEVARHEKEKSSDTNV